MNTDQPFFDPADPNDPERRAERWREVQAEDAAAIDASLNDARWKAWAESEAGKAEAEAQRRLQSTDWNLCEAERRILRFVACCYIPEWLGEVTAVLEPEHFDDHLIARLYRAAVALRRKGADTYMFAVCQDAGVPWTPDYEDILAIPWSGAQGVPGAEVEAVRAAYASRQIAAELQRVRANAPDAAAVASAMEGAAKRLRADTAAIPAVRSTSQIASALMAEIRSAPAATVSTGIHNLDRALGGGLRAGQMVLIGARPGVGKSTLAQTVAAAAIARGLPVAFFSLEMAESDVLLRMCAAHTGIAVNRVLARDLNDEEDTATEKALAKVCEGNLFKCIAAGKLTPDQITAQAIRHLAGRFGLVVVDYLQLVQGRGEMREQQVASVSRACKALAQDLSIPVLALSQLNRAVEARATKRPMLSDLRESGAIEQDSDVVIFVHRPDPTVTARSPFEAELIIAKQRNGEPGVVKARFDGERQSFGDA